MLPQKHDWQVTLRNWIQGRDLLDFECGLPGLSFSPDYFESDDDIYRTWITFEDLGRRITKIKGVRIDPSCYLLENIEADDGVYMRLYDRVEPAAMAWLYSWDYPGNPYHQNDQVANRALVACMVDMMMAYDASIEAGNYDYFSQTYGSAFASWAYVLDACKAHLSIPEAARYTEALEEFFAAFEDVGPTGIQADMDLPVLIGMHYTGLFSQGYAYAAEPYAKILFEKHFNEAGYIDHGGGADLGYNGISLKYVAWLAHVTQWDFVIDALAKMSKLKARLTFPEPTDDGLYKFYGPSNFATATAGGSPRDQHWTFGRDVAISYLTDEAAYLRYTGRNLNPWDQPYGLKTPDEMMADIEDWTRRANEQEANDTFGTWTRPLDETPKIWGPSWHLEGPQLEHDYYPEGFYHKVSEGVELPPFDNPGMEISGLVTLTKYAYFIQQHGSDFVTWKLGGMGGAIHTGGLSWYPDRDNGGLCGLSGGSLAAFWTEKGGIGILGRGRGSQGPTPDTRDNIDSWMVNHVWGCDLAGSRSSSARHKEPGKTISLDRENGIVTVEGKIEPADIAYRRVFDISAEGLQITLDTYSNPPAGLDGCLYETIPLWLGDGYSTDSLFDEGYPAIWVKVDSHWIRQINTEVSMQNGVIASAVKVERNNHLMLIEFETPQAVRLGSVWSTGYQRTRERGVPLHIDIKEKGSVRYKISGPYVHELKKV